MAGTGQQPFQTHQDLPKSRLWKVGGKATTIMYCTASIVESLLALELMPTNRLWPRHAALTAAHFIGLLTGLTAVVFRRAIRYTYCFSLPYKDLQDDPCCHHCCIKIYRTSPAKRLQPH